MKQRSIWYLAIAETLVWAGMFYSFPALILHWETDLGWTKTQLYATFTTALIVSAFAAPLVGHLIDRGYGRMMLSSSALIGGVMVGVLSFIEQFWIFFVSWLLLAFAMAGCLYEPCFSYLTRTRGLEAKKPITMITLVAGFAGSVSFPTANIVAEWYGWRGSTFTFAVLILFIAVPLFVLGTGTEEALLSSKMPVGKTENGMKLIATISGPAFWLLAMSFTTIAVCHGMLITHLLPMLAELNTPGVLAVTVASLFGPMQVLGRVVIIYVERHVSMYTICGSTFLLMLCGLGALIFAGSLPELVLVFVFLHGSGNGLTSITRPVVTADLLGREGFGSISGAIALFSMSGFALAPLFAAGIWEWGGYDLMLKLACVIVFSGFAAYLLALLISRK